MELRQFGKTDMRVSVLGFGGSEIGFEDVEQSQVNKLLNTALDGGLNVIDTGECYKNSEEKIGNAVSHRRNDFYLFTKMGHAFPGSTDPDWSPKLLRESIEHSLKALRTDRLDLLQLHTCNLEMLKAGAVIEIIQEAKAAGKTRYIGYSGDREEAAWAAESGIFDSLQTSINVADQQVLDLGLPKAHAAGIGVIAKRPVANVAWRWGVEEPKSTYHRDYWERLGKLQYDFLNLPPEEAVAFALRFTLSQPGVCVAIVGSGKPERFAQNAAAAAQGPLKPAEIESIIEGWKAVAGPDWTGCG